MDNARFSALLAVIAAAVAGGCGDDTQGTGGAASSTTTGGVTSATGTSATGATTSSGSATSGTGSGSATGATSGASTGQGGGGGAGGAPTIRRPFLVGSSLVHAGTIARSDWLSDLVTGSAEGLERDAELSGATRAMLANTWLADAREEHASVAAFARFTMLLLSVGAPPDLVRDSQRASIDEIEHAKACFALARRHGAGDVGPGDLDVGGSLKPMSLAEIAALCAEEGCVGETLGAALAVEQRERCTDPATKKILDRLVRDEARHASLSWTFVSWAVKKGGDEVRDAVVAAVRRAIDETLRAPRRVYDGVDIDQWHAMGRVTCDEARAVARQASETVIEPALRLLGERRGDASRIAVASS